MGKEIAVLLDTSMNTSTFNKPGIVVVYYKAKDGWTIKKSIPYNFGTPLSLDSIRASIKELSDALGECRILVGSEVAGIAYNTLNALGFGVWEIDGSPLDFLQYVLENEESEQTNSSVTETATTKLPVQTDTSHYYFNLKELQLKQFGLSTKQALLPFLSQTDFKELIVICSHIPPWFESEFEKLGLQSVLEQLSANEYKLTISHK